MEATETEVPDEAADVDDPDDVVEVVAPIEKSLLVAKISEVFLFMVWYHISPRSTLAARKS